MTGHVAPAGLIARSLAESHATLMQVAQQADAVAAVAAPILATLAGGGKLLLCGNGGSAADAQHVAAELVVRFRRERRALPAIALTTDTSQLTAIGNDYDFTRLFARQVEALARPGDLLVAISTSGNSPNVLAAVATARQLGVATLGFSGTPGGALARSADCCYLAPSAVTARIQEAHIVVWHAICECIDAHFAD
ncbi:MAG: SIS domain-containing protein [Chloroflexi bacterium]|nr:SIS domain-containing protein [Chloroflexota bacterium]